METIQSAFRWAVFHLMALKLIRGVAETHCRSSDLLVYNYAIVPAPLLLLLCYYEW